MGTLPAWWEGTGFKDPSYTSYPPIPNTDPFPFQCLSPPPLGLGGGSRGPGPDTDLLDFTVFC